MRRTVYSCFLIMVFMVSLSLLSCGGGSSEETSSAGPLDGTFGMGGKVTTAIRGADSIDDEAFALATIDNCSCPSDGKLVAAGKSKNNLTGAFEFALARYNTDGSLDTTFNPGGTIPGVVTTAIRGAACATPGSACDDGAFAAVVQSDGKVVAAGVSNNGTEPVFALIRYNTDGSLDPGFGSGGVVVTNISAYDDEITALAIQPSDGKLVAAGYSYNTGLGQYLFALARYNTDGSLDAAFGAGGIVTTMIRTFTGNKKDQAFALTIQRNNKLVAGGTSLNSGGFNQFAMVRYNTDGSIDTAFNSPNSVIDQNISGSVITAIGGGGHDVINSLIIDQNGRVVAAGYSANGGQFVFAVGRYNTDGTLDTSFGLSGIVTTASAPLGKNDRAYALGAQINGKLVIAGFSNTGNTPSVFETKFAVVRYAPTGSLDPTFGSKGIAVTSIDNYDDEAFALLIQPDMTNTTKVKLVTAGKSVDRKTGLYRFALIRYSPPL